MDSNSIKERAPRVPRTTEDAAADRAWGDAIRMACRARGVEPRDLAPIVGVSPDQLSRRLRQGPWAVTDIARIARYIGMTAEGLYAVGHAYEEGRAVDLVPSSPDLGPPPPAL